MKVTYDGSHYLIEYPANQDLRGRITETIVKNGGTILSMESVAMSLEDAFLKLTAHEEEEGEEEE